MSQSPASHLHFVQSIEPLEGGGLGRAALELHAAFLAAGVSSRLATTCASAPQAADRADVMEFPRAGPSRFFYAPGLRAAAAPLVRDATVLHAHGFYVGTNWLLGGEARRQGRALVCHPHGFFEPWILARSRARKRVVHWWFENANFRAARLWRALTAKEADQIRAQGVTAPVIVAPNGVQLDAFDVTDATRASTWNHKGRRRLLFLGRLHPKKGLRLLIPAWVRAEAAAREWELVIAGPDELGHRAEVDALVRASGSEGSISFTGTVKGADKVALLRSADAFILPSFSEGFSVAILESLACGVPVVATHACNFPELELEGGGWLCAATEDAVTAALQRVMASSPEERRQRGLAGRALVEQRYTWPAIVRVILDACAQHC